MKNIFILLILLFLILIHSSIGSSIILENPKHINQTEINILCKIVNDITSDSKDTQDVLIGRVGRRIEESVIDKITKCIKKDKAVVHADLNRQMKNDYNLRKVAVMVVEMKNTDKQPILNAVNDYLNLTALNHLAKVILIVHDQIIAPQSIDLLSFFNSIGFLNVALAHKSDGRIHVDFTKSVRNSFYTSNVINDGRAFFTDKLKDLRGSVIVVPIYTQKPRIFIENGIVHGSMLEFLKILMEKMNMRPQLKSIRDMAELINLWKHRRMSLTLNTAVRTVNPDLNAPKLKTYMLNGHCALIPRPQSTSAYDLIFIKPFDADVWMCIFATAVACFGVWKLFQKRGTSDSHWLLLFGIFAMFIGQGVEFRRTKRIVLIILLQLIIVMIFVLSNGYQGVITSFMIQPEQENRLKTVNDLLKADFKVKASPNFENIIQDAEEFDKIRTNMEVTVLETKKENIQEFMKEQAVMIAECDLAEHLLTSRNIDLSEYYILPERLITYYETLEASFLNPFLERFQCYMDRSFEAGLQHAWDLFSNWLQRTPQKTEHHDEILKLKDLTQVFYVLFFGSVLSVIAFLFEIFFHDCLKHLKVLEVLGKIKNRINKIEKVRNKSVTSNRSKKNKEAKKKKNKIYKPKIQFINVEPFNRV